MINPKSKLDPEKYARLKAEAQAPYKGLRQFVYIAFGASGFIGALVFLAQLAAGREISKATKNLLDSAQKIVLDIPQQLTETMD